MLKKYVVRLTEEERAELSDVIRKLKGTGQKVRRAQILLKADANGPGWTDRQIAEAFTASIISRCNGPDACQSNSTPPGASFDSPVTAP